MSIENPGQIAQNQALFNACTKGNVVEVQRLLDAGADVNLPDRYNKTPLHLAALYGHTAVAEILIRCQADVNLQDRDGRTPLHTATVSNNTALAEILINARADVNLQDIQGRAPLHCQSIYRNAALAEILINARADVNLQNDEGIAPIHLAAIFHNFGLVEQMLKAYARVQCNGQLVPHHEELCNLYAGRMFIAAGPTQDFHQAMEEFQNEIRVYMNRGQFTKVALREQPVAPTEDEEEDDTETHEDSMAHVYVTASQAADAVTDTSEQASTIVVAAAAPASSHVPQEAGWLDLDLDDLDLTGESE